MDAYNGTPGLEEAGFSLEAFEAFTPTEQASLVSYQQNGTDLARVKCTLKEWMTYPPEFQQAKLKFASDAISKGMT